MKTYLMGIALTIMFLFFIVYQGEFNRYYRQTEGLKHLADECAATACLYHEDIEYSLGKVYFNEVEASKAVAEIMKSTKSSYWRLVNYELKFFDDKNTNFPVLHKENDQNFYLTEPTVLVFMEAKPPLFSILKIPDIKVLRASTYEVIDYKER